MIIINYYVYNILTSRIKFKSKYEYYIIYRPIRMDYNPYI